ncbi:TPA: aldehyde dehydrogenase family protein [Pseudomonas putida]|uniref:aldehyde dehydrogenase family protein n=1 Tax=Pseudomonas putida TaxID=303 RepID=UPI00110CE52A|nr:aldehyde dehydrogenase family protein [Pseudomonas putida]MDD1992738.1 aldehyde dehydrogenase family protein [Pseudomonas putida]HDS0918420.1 aldehyde dehydrogenase family protein [Pseudomonas putida]HDS0931701.1 aldehyde dehydrogenase family protein [Pseudomonas putida]HDS1782329.1 aldehyde dehydrogenase family protein [Pseudomonas putida]HDS3796978.1 aldehyde dehydrogenase family protein [Pseudomonas putida]
MTDLAATSLKTYHPYINGRSWGSDDQPEQVVINPYDQTPIARVKLATAADIDSAIAAAYEAQKSWGKTLAKEREAVLCRAADIIERRRGDIAKILIEEGGNVFGKAMFECDYMVSTFRIAAGQARDVRGETMPADGPGRISMSFRQPLGVIAGVGPFNAPLLLNGKKLAPALAAGNAFLLKPAPQTPLIGLLFAEILEEAGLPPGVFNVLPTTNEALGDTFFSDKRVKMVTFTGSAKVGQYLSELAGKFQKRIVLELGGKSPIVILQDADLDYAVRAAAFGIFFNQGQVCMANSRIIVEAPIYDTFCRAFAEKVRSIRSGDPADPSTIIGPLINARQCEFIKGQIDDAVSKGATLLAGGEYRGNLFQPSVLTDVGPSMAVYNEETFGPLVSIYKARDYEHAVELANDTSYGLSSGIVTNDLQKAFDFAMRVEAGSVHINDNSFDDDPNAPFGGFKDSGHGKENGRYSVQDMTELKWVTLQLGERKFPL